MPCAQLLQAQLLELSRSVCTAQHLGSSACSSANGFPSSRYLSCGMYVYTLLSQLVICDRNPRSGRVVEDPIELPILTWGLPLGSGTDRYRCSCEDKNTIESPIARRSEASLATVWQGLVCRMHDVDHWQFFEGGHSYVSSLRPHTTIVSNEKEED